MAAARNRSVRSSSRSDGPDEQQLAEGVRVERERDLDRHGLGPGRWRRAGAGGRHERRERIGRDAPGQRRPRLGVGDPGEAQLRQPGHRRGTRRRLDLRGGQQVGERVEVVADTDPPLRARLQGRRAATGERIEDDVTRPRVARDERVGQRRREAREVRAHRMERVAPEALLGLPLGFDRDGRQRDREVEGELLRGGARSRAGGSDRHGQNGPLSVAPVPAGAGGGV